jgi:putative spermidine/putrescine transport system permease protein
MTATRHPALTAILWLAAILMLLPVLATFLNSIATGWTGGILPSGLSLDAYQTILSDGRFQSALLRSIAVAGLALTLACLLIVPAVIAAHLYWPTLDTWMARLVILPYAVPTVILMVGYLRVFSAPPLQFSGQPIVLVLTYVPLCFPMFYINVKNSLQALDTAELLEAGRLLGIGDARLLRRVILPSIFPGIALAVVLNFAGLMSEFVYARMLVGGQFETLQMYMFAQRDLSGRLSSVIVTVYFLITLLITFAAFRLVWRKETKS